MQQQTASQKINVFSLQYNFSCLSKNWSIFIWSDHGDLISQSLNCHDPLSFISLKIWRKCEALLIQSLQLHLDQRLMTDVERGVENKISVLDQYRNTDTDTGKKIDTDTHTDIDINTQSGFIAVPAARDRLGICKWFKRQLLTKQPVF